jgi:hypothetical protein
MREWTNGPNGIMREFGTGKTWKKLEGGGSAKRGRKWKEWNGPPGKSFLGFRELVRRGKEEAFGFG